MQQLLLFVIDSLFVLLKNIKVRCITTKCQSCYSFICSTFFFFFFTTFNSSVPSVDQEWITQLFTYLIMKNSLLKAFKPLNHLVREVIGLGNTPTVGLTVYMSISHLWIISIVMRSVPCRLRDILQSKINLNVDGQTAF